MKTFIFASITLIFLSGCLEYREPLCSLENRVDVANLEGRFSTTFEMTTAERSDVIRVGLTITRLEKGRYLTQSSDKARTLTTCAISGQVYLEEKGGGPSGREDTYLARRPEANGDGSFDLIYVGADSDILKARGLNPVIELPKKPVGESDAVTPIGSSSTLETYIMIADNRQTSSEEFVQLLDSLSLKQTWHPDVEGF